MWTKIECKRCGRSAIRRFKVGDYVFKRLAYPCPYCEAYGVHGDLDVVGIWRDDSRERAE